MINPEGLPRGLSGKGHTCQCRRQGFDPYVGKIPWRRKWQLMPVFLPGKPHGQRSLAGYSPWGCKESDTTEQLSMHARSVQRIVMLVSPNHLPLPMVLSQCQQSMQFRKLSWKEQTREDECIPLWKACW